MARKDSKAFWAKAAKELDWFKPWKRVLEWKCPWAKWFVGGKINDSYNCLDRHVNPFDNPPTGRGLLRVDGERDTTLTLCMA